MQRLMCTLVLAAALAACGSGTDSSNPPASPFTVTVVSQSRTGGAPQPWIDVIVFQVTDKVTLDVVSGATVVTQTTAGTVETLPLITAANGRVTATWTIDVADQGSGVTHEMAFCAPKLGGSFCKTKLGQAENITITF